MDYLHVLGGCKEEPQLWINRFCYKLPQGIRPTKFKRRTKL